ncbi:hypothetical protein [Aeromicrobium sp.]|uniref:hypothetical protein n=1 Tax=Aeromicrobium sp. TaxID=1871063 RepID=UPI0019AE54BE|nr:hypothetical protein [Aeromicrobium sp.]MBC7631404.1 hypothetical protein [Aeromicrobium sp.]
MNPTDVPVPPITLCDSGNLDVFADVASAVHDIDLEDVRNGRKAVDSRGMPLYVVDNGAWPIDLRVAENAESAADDLERRLRDAIRNLGPDRVGLPGFEAAPLATLLDALLRFQVGTPFESRLSKLFGNLRRRDRATRSTD